MLDVLRKKKRSWVIVFLIGIIVLVFVLWGVGSFISGPESENIAEVNGEIIHQREFAMQYERLLDAYRELFKGALTPEMIKSLNLRSGLLEELIQRRLLLQEARSLGLDVADEELRASIAAIPEFRVGGQFSKERYLQALRLNRVSPGQFEAEHKEQLAIQKLYDLIRDAVQVTEGEARERYRLQQEKVDFYFIRLAVEDFLPKAQVSAEEIKNYYDRNKGSFKEPLRVQVEYLTYPFNRFSDKVQVGDKEIEAYYNQYRDTRFREPEAVRVRHILLRIPQGADAKQKETVRAKAEGVLREARAGKDFALLAKEYSEDPSAVQGGDVGWFSPGQMLPVLDRAAFALKKGEVSGLLESSSGYHILKVEETKAGKTKSLKEARGEIVQTLVKERSRSEAAKAVDGDREKLLSGTGFEAPAKARGIPLKVSPLFARSESVLEAGPLEEFNKAAFSLAFKEISRVIEGPTAYYLMRLKERKEPSIPPLERVRADIEKRLKATRAREMALQKGGALLEQLKKQKDIKKLASRHGLKLEETGWFVRGNSQIPKVGLLEEVQPGGIPISAYQPVADRLYSTKSALYVFAFKDRQSADMELFEKENKRLEAQMLNEKRERALQKYIENLKAKARIEVKAPFLLEES